MFLNAFSVGYICILFVFYVFNALCCPCGIINDNKNNNIIQRNLYETMLWHRL